jgi:tryptophan synthase alpha subunit
VPGRADGVIVGSAIVEIVERNLNDHDTMERELKKYVSDMKRVLVKGHES